MAGTPTPLPGGSAAHRSISRDLRVRLIALGMVAPVFLMPAAPMAADAPEMPPEIEAAETEDSVRLYRTNSERREAGLHRQLTPWLTFSGLLELEAYDETLSLKGSPAEESFDTGNASVQLGLVATPLEWLKGEVVVEYESETREWFTEEAILSLEAEPWELEGGILYLPFGEYISHFPTGPILEFGETQANAVTLSYGEDDRLDFTASLYRGRSRELGSGDKEPGWAAAVQAWPTDSLLLGASLISNLADSDDRLLEDTNDRYQRRVPGVSAYLVWTTPEYEISLEGVSALRSFSELDSDRDRPAAWNLEFVHFVSHDFEWALRVEGSDEVEDEPELRFGAAITWRPHSRVSVSLEYLDGRYREGLAVNDDDEPYDRVQSIGAQVSFAF